MNKTVMTLLLSFMLTALFCGCSVDFWHPGDTVNTGPASQLASKLASLPENTASTPHNITLIVKITREIDFINEALREAPNKYVNLDLTGSTITIIGGGYSFTDCASLVSIIIPNSVTRIEGWAFASCTSLTSVTIPNSITNIFAGTFKFCKSLTSVTIPVNVTSIGNQAFEGCTSLTSVTIPAGVSSIDYWAFDDCTSLTSVTFQGTIPSSDFSSTFPGDLRAKFYASNLNNGTPGTYTRPSGSNTWTRQ